MCRLCLSISAEIWTLDLLACWKLLKVCKFRPSKFTEQVDCFCLSQVSTWPKRWRHLDIHTGENTFCAKIFLSLFNYLALSKTFPLYFCWVKAFTFINLWKLSLCAYFSLSKFTFEDIMEEDTHDQTVLQDHTATGFYTFRHQFCCNKCHLKIAILIIFKDTT